MRSTAVDTVGTSCQLVPSAAYRSGGTSKLLVPTPAPARGVGLLLFLLLAVPLSAMEVLPIEGDTYATVCADLGKCPYPVTCKVRIADGELGFLVETTTEALSDAENKLSLLQKTGFSFFIDPFRNLHTIFALTMDFSGNTALHRVHLAEYITQLPVKPVATIKKTTDQAQVLVRLPLLELGIVPGNGDVWGLTVIGYLLDKDGKPQSYWRPGDAGIHCWSVRTGMPLPRTCPLFHVGADPTGVSLTRGSLTPREVYAQNRFAWTWLRPPEAGKGTLVVRPECEVEKERIVFSHEFDYAAGEPAPLNVRYTLPPTTTGFSFSVLDKNRKKVYSSRYPALPNMPSRFPSPKNHFRKDCVQTVEPDPRLKGDVQITWTHGLRPEIMKMKAQDCGYPYDQRNWLKYLKETRQAVIIPYPSYWGGRKQLIEWSERIREAGVHVALMPTGADALKEVPHTPKGAHQMFHADPKAQDAYLAAMKEALTEYGDIIHYIYFGDEFEECLMSAAIYLWQEKRRDYPPIERVGREIREKYGFGKYGIPDKSSYRWQGQYMEPYHWIALRRWAADFTVEFAKRVKGEARKLKPDILMISPDPKAGNRPQYYEGWRGLFDVATHQVYLKPVKEELMFPGFVTKLIRDLSGVPHVWPCLHLESLGAYYSPEEVRECLSQTFIAGSTGMHTWPIPTGRGSLTCIDRLDAPGRQNMLDQFGDLVAAGLRARHDPARELALLYSHDACAAHPDDYGIPQPPRAYQYLSDGCAVNFRIVGDYGLGTGQEKLEGYQTLVVPVADIIRRTATEKVLSALEGGLNLVVLQPNAFSHHLDGSSTEMLATRMRGGARLARREAGKNEHVVPDQSCKLLDGLEAKRLPIAGPDFDYPFTDLSPYLALHTFTDLPKGAEVLLRYSDGKAAGVAVPVGKGRTVWLGFGSMLPLYSQEWVDFYRTLLRNLGHKLDRPVWRLLLPLEFRPVDQGWVYLTGNAFHHECSIPQATQSAYLPGTYRYSLAPDGQKDVGEAGAPIPFSEGRLTNRPRPVNYKNVVAWKTAEPFTVDFDLAGSCRVDRVDVYVSDFDPGVELLASTDGKAYESVAKTEASGEVEGVAQVVLEVPRLSPKCRYWRLAFAARPEGQASTLAEVDILQKDRGD